MFVGSESIRALCCTMFLFFCHSREINNMRYFMINLLYSCGYIVNSCNDKGLKPVFWHCEGTNTYLPPSVWRQTASAPPASCASWNPSQKHTLWRRSVLQTRYSVNQVYLWYILCIPCFTGCYFLCSMILVLM